MGRISKRPELTTVEKERRVRTLLDIALPRIKNTKTQGNYASYDIEPLEAGDGMKPGKALCRRVFYSLPREATNLILIYRAQHEIQDIAPLMQDVSAMVHDITKRTVMCRSD